MVGLALVREFVYAYAAVSPGDGCLDYWTAPKMNTEYMSQFLVQVRTAHPGEFIIMVLDGASSHKSKDLKIPEHMVLIKLPPYSPELNPTELIWNEMRRKEFANRVFDSLEAVVFSWNMDSPCWPQTKQQLKVSPAGTGSLTA